MRFLTKLFPKRKPEWAALCEVAWTDPLGRSYYKYSDEMNMPLTRKHEIDKCLMELKYGRDFDDVIGAMELAINKQVKGKSIPDVQATAYLIQELKERREFLFDSNVLFELCALSLIREDESPYLPNLTKEKIKTFQDHIGKGGLYFFLIAAGTNKYLPLSDISISQFNHLIQTTDQRMRRTSDLIDRISAQKSANTI